MVFLASVLNYLDRQALSILAPSIQKDLNLSNDGYAWIGNFFLIAYTISYIGSGRLVDRLGNRLGMVLFVGWWSISNMLTGLARSFASLAGFRFALGLGEAGNYTVAPKVAAEWFPPNERGLAMGFSTLGATVGATIAPILVVELASRFGWRSAFVVTGALGLVWLIPWWFIYKTPAQPAHDSVQTPTPPTQPESITESNPESRTKLETGTWRAILLNREVWGLMAARLLTDPVWYFYQFWFAKYLNAERGVAQKDLSVTWKVYLAADLGSLLAGLISGWLIKRGTPPSRARMRVMLGCACLLPLSPLVSRVPDLNTCLLVAMLLVFLHMIWLINLSALVVDRIPNRILGTAFGVVAAGSTIGGILMNPQVAHLADRHDYGSWFTIAAFLHPLAWIVLALTGLHQQQSSIAKES